MRGIIKALKRLDPLAVAIVALLLFILFLILTATGTVNISGDDDNLPIGTIQQETANDFVEEPDVRPDDFPESKELLSALPYNSNDFIVNYLPLEEDASPKIVVYFLRPDAEEKFKNWLKHFDYSDDVEFIYQSNAQDDVEDSVY